MSGSTCEGEPAARCPSRCRARWSTRTAIWTSPRRSPGWSRPTLSSRAAAVGVRRIVQIGCDLAGAALRGARRPSAGTRRRRRGHPPQRRGPDAADELPRPRRDRAAGRATPGSGRSGRPGSTTTAPGTRPGTGLQRDTFAWHIALAHATTRPWSSTTGMPTPTCSTCWTPRVYRTGSSCTASPATPTSPGRAWTAGPASPSPARSRSRRTSTLREALRITPLDRILTETDAPYLTPVPYRGRPNASYLIPYTARAMAETLDGDLTEVCRALDDNAVRRVRRPLGSSA